MAEHASEDHQHLSKRSPVSCCLQLKLLDLPSELLCRIFSFVSNKEKVQVLADSSVPKQWRQLMSSIFLHRCLCMLPRPSSHSLRCSPGCTSTAYLDEQIPWVSLRHPRSCLNKSDVNTSHAYVPCLHAYLGTEHIRVLCIEIGLCSTLAGGSTDLPRIQGSTASFFDCKNVWRCDR